MADPNPSTLDKLAAIAGKVSTSLTVAGIVINLGEMALSRVAAFLDSSGADLSELDKTHAEYLRREVLAKDPNS